MRDAWITNPAMFGSSVVFIAMRRDGDPHTDHIA
jgi:hypothetical protein